MPLYMHTHRNVADLSEEAVAGAHKADLATQEKYGVDYKQYWYNETAGAVYCLVEAPNAEAIREAAKRANLPADSIIEVDEINPAMFA